MLVLQCLLMLFWCLFILWNFNQLCWLLVYISLYLFKKLMLFWCQLFWCFYFIIGRRFCGCMYFWLVIFQFFNVVLVFFWFWWQFVFGYFLVLQCFGFFFFVMCNEVQIIDKGYKNGGSNSDYSGRNCRQILLFFL